ncbi:hypothetical protein ACIRP3_18775 [Streptomyces sp. NPDC101209]|uniref:hypothetical protein n=1 Tax=Streptomyces sp. NPDC101209 TaxID=3366129 RepID=UPI0038140DA0
MNDEPVLLPVKDVSQNLGVLLTPAEESTLVDVQFPPAKQRGPAGRWRRQRRAWAGLLGRLRRTSPAPQSLAGRAKVAGGATS